MTCSAKKSHKPISETLGAMRTAFGSGILSVIELPAIHASNPVDGQAARHTWSSALSEYLGDTHQRFAERANAKSGWGRSTQIVAQYAALGAGTFASTGGIVLGMGLAVHTLSSLN